MSQKAIMVVLTNPSSSDRDEEYNTWYDETHLREVTEVPGILSARRYVVSAVQHDPPSSLGDQRYLAIYEIETDDLASISPELVARSTDGRFEMTDALQTSPEPTVVFYEAL